ncbi:MAG: serine/threonine-protein kinase [Bryobacteraceae bacterium]
MTPVEWQEVKRIVGEALVREEPEREAFLSSALADRPDLRDEVESLIEASREAEDFLEAPADPLIGTRLGPYMVEECVGSGGMGSVYLATRRDGEFTMRVAIKVVKRGMDTDGIVRRFRSERQILARLSHPNIARLFDGGVTRDGRPYFVMEAVEGKRIDEAARDLPLDKKLDLFRSVCEAVQYAHAHLVIHGDIKAGNILVTPEGIPKLLDFGIARLTETDPEQTETANTMPPAFTPEYSSPEQLRGQALSTSSDVYSLGVLLCELLCGRRPWQFEFPHPEHILRTITEHEPALPSKVSGDSRLRGDLDNIVRRAVQADVERRYRSVEQLSEDIRRHREGLPVTARPDTFLYRTTKFAYRNRLAVAAGITTVAALGIGLGIATVEARRAIRQQTRAEARFNDVRTLAMSVFEVEKDLAQLRDSTPIRRRLLDHVAQYLEKINERADDDPTLLNDIAQAYQKLGDVQGRPNVSNVGNPNQALESYGKALKIRAVLYARFPADKVQTMAYSEGCVRYAGLLNVMSDHAKALEWNRKAVELRQQLLQADPANHDLQRSATDALLSLGSTLSLMGDWPAVLDNRRQVYESYKKLASDPNSDVDAIGLGLAARRYAGILFETGNVKSAIPLFRESLAIETRLMQRKPGNREQRITLAMAQNVLAYALTESGDHAGAIPVARQSVQNHEECVAFDPRDFRARNLLSTALTTLGNAQIRAGQPKPGAVTLDRSRVMREEMYHESPANAGVRGQVAEIYSSLGDAARAMGNKPGAIEWYRRAGDMLDDLKARNQANAAMEKIRKRNQDALAAAQAN